MAVPSGSPEGDAASVGPPGTLGAPLGPARSLPRSLARPEASGPESRAEAETVMAEQVDPIALACKALDLNGLVLEAVELLGGHEVHSAKMYDPDRQKYVEMCGECFERWPCRVTQWIFRAERVAVRRWSR